MTQSSEPRSFFERITGARILSAGERDVPYKLNTTTKEEYDPDNIPEADLEQALEEPTAETEESYSDEDTGFTETEQEGQLTVDVFQDDQSIIVQSTIAGVSPDDLDVSITNDMISIRGERRRQFSVDPEDYFYQECYWGTFSRSIILPVEIDADRAEAKIKNGVLTIRIPKANAAMTRKLKVKAS